MKKFISTLFLVLAFLGTHAQKSDVIDTKVHNMVMQFTAGDSSDQASIVLQVGNIRRAWPKANIEVVCHGGGIEMLQKGKSKVGNAIADLSAQGIVFAACQNTMTRRNIKREDLLPSAQVVPSAMVELVMKQEQGWAYLKGAH